MLHQTKSSVFGRQAFHLIIIYLTYAVFALIFGLAYRYAINPDGTSMLRLAGYIADGNFLQSVSPGYPPLTTWLISLFMFLGFDGLTAARIAMAVCGAILLLSGWILTQRFNVSENMKFIAFLIAALLISFWTIQHIGSDILFASLILFYIYLVTDPDLLSRRYYPFYCGVAGGLAYMAHHYAFPFFLAHFPLLLLAWGYLSKDRSGIPWKKILRSWGAGVAGFMIIASIWIGVSSVKNGKFTISASGGPAHAVMGPKDVDRRHPFFVGGLFKPKADYSIHVFEDSSDVKFKTWSPFESKEYFIHQLNVMKLNLTYILNHFVNKSPFFTYAFIIGLLVLIPIAIFLSPLNSRNRYLYTWIVLTFSIYCSGFILLIARSPRRFYAFMIIFLIASFHFIEELIHSFRDNVSDKSKQLLTVYLVAIAVLAFAIKPSVELIKSAKHIATVDQVNPYKDIAQQINRIDFPAPYAIIRSSQKLTTDYYLTYFLNKQLLGRPNSKDIDGITQELKRSGGKSLVVFDNPQIAEKLKLDSRYLHKGLVKLSDSKRYKHTVKWIVTKHEIITGWDNEVNIFTLK